MGDENRPEFSAQKEAAVPSDSPKHTEAMITRHSSEVLTDQAATPGIVQPAKMVNVFVAELFPIKCDVLPSCHLVVNSTPLGQAVVHHEAVHSAVEAVHNPLCSLVHPRILLPLYEVVEGD